MNTKKSNLTLTCLGVATLSILVASSLAVAEPNVAEPNVAKPNVAKPVTPAPKSEFIITFDASKLVLIDAASQLYSVTVSTAIGPVRLVVQKGNPQKTEVAAGKD